MNTELGTNSRPDHAAWSTLQSQMRTPKPRDAHVIASDRIHPSKHFTHQPFATYPTHGDSRPMTDSVLNVFIATESI